MLGAVVGVLAALHGQPRDRVLGEQPLVVAQPLAQRLQGAARVLLQLRQPPALAHQVLADQGVFLGRRFLALVQHPLPLAQRRLRGEVAVGQLLVDDLGDQLALLDEIADPGVDLGQHAGAFRHRVQHLAVAGQEDAVRADVHRHLAQHRPDQHAERHRRQQPGREPGPRRGHHQRPVQVVRSLQPLQRLLAEKLFHAGFPSAERVAARPAHARGRPARGKQAAPGARAAAPGTPGTGNLPAPSYQFTGIGGLM